MYKLEFTNKRKSVELTNDGKDAADIIIGVTGDEEIAKKAYEKITNLKLGESFTEPGMFTVSCYAEKAITEDDFVFGRGTYEMPINKSEETTKLHVYDSIDGNHRLSYWYGGVCACFKYDGCEVVIEACGDVFASLTIDEEEIAFVKDKRNGGRFYEEMSPYIKDDKELLEMMRRDQLCFYNNNWWEVFVYDSENNFHDLMWSLDADTLDEAIKEVADELSEIINHSKE